MSEDATKPSRDPVRETMGEKEEKKRKDAFYRNVVFPEVESIFSFRLKSIQAIKDDCFFVLDTNSLLVPYTAGKDSLEQIGKICKDLIQQQRLIIPGQVVREFAELRPYKLAELHQRLSKVWELKEIELGTYPLLESLEEYKQSLELGKEISKLIREYKSTVSKVVNHIEEWNWDDPVSQLYSEMFTKEMILDPSFIEDDITSDLARRKKNSIPPGYKDRGVGDLLIWQTILKVAETQKKSVIFVSGDEKADWFYRSNNEPLYPRYELIDEFRRLSG